MASESKGVIQDKRGKLAALSSMERVVIDVGCGQRRRCAEAITVDALDYDAVDVVGDVYAVLSAIPDGSVDEVMSSHFVEHLADLERFVRESRRVLKIGGVLRAVAPHFSNPYFYSDYTHRSHFGLYTLSYLAEDNVLRRKVPHYSEDTGLELVSVRLLFKAPRPFYVSFVLRRVLQVLVNAATWTKESYERSWCFMFPCYEVDYVLIRRF